MKRTMYDTKMITLSFVGNNSDQFILSNMINSNFCGSYNVHKKFLANPLLRIDPLHVETIIRRHCSVKYACNNYLTF